VWHWLTGNKTEIDVIDALRSIAESARRETPCHCAEKGGRHASV
jgi:hypothetical protein